MPDRVILVSNRLPVTIRKTEAGMEILPSSGGLATALRSFNAGAGLTWFGWPGVVPRKDRTTVEQTLLSAHQSVPVFLPARTAERFYEGFSNRTLWPLFHSFASYTHYVEGEWEAYKEANERFADRIARSASDDSLIWIHDYQLMLLPRVLRERLPGASIGFFLHIPFPPYEIFRLLPQGRELLTALLAADLVGFHTHEYAQAFLGCVRRLLGHENTLGELMIGPRNVQVDVFPIGIDFDSFAQASATPETRKAVATLKGTADTRKLIFSVCRLDYTKGIPQSLAGVEAFLNAHPEWRGKFEYTLVVVPSRERVERYGSLKREIDELIGRINSTHGTLEWTPVRYVYRSLSFQELIALYAAADVALILPLRDGMNLVAKEYLASRRDEQGVLLLSEMTGAAKELLEALIVNPNSTHEVASALLEALTMPAEEQVRRNSVMRRRLATYNVHWWVKRFIDRLTDVSARSHRLTVKILEGAPLDAMLKEYRETPHRLMMFDYDGTLAPFASTPGGARPDAQLREQLRALASAPGNTVVVLSSRDRRTLEEWLGDLPLTLAAEHGAWMRTSGAADWTATISQSQDFWKSQIRPTLDLVAERIPGSFVEEKDFALVWHYRRADPESGWTAARELLDTLTNIAANLGIQVLPASKAIEIKTMEMNKGIFYTRYLTSLEPRFILAAGDDWKDEALFSVLPSSAYSIRIGMNASHARFNLTGVRDMRALLTTLAGAAPLAGASR